MSNTYIMHHDDLDGQSGALIIKNSLKTNAKLVACSYDNIINPLSIVDKNDSLILVDYSFEPTVMQKLFELLNNRFVWIDHHISAINKSQQYSYDNILGIRDLNYCGAELSYMYYVSKDNIPVLLKEIGNFDMFRTFGTKQFENTLSVFYACTAYSKILKESIAEIVKNKEDKKYYDFFVKQGKSIFAYELARYKEDCQNNAYVKNIWNKRVLCMNTSEGGLGLQLTKVFDPAKHDMILTYNFNGKNWSYGFYTDAKAHPEVNCAEIAELYGGGGHKAAAGARLDGIFEELLS